MIDGKSVCSKREQVKKMPKSRPLFQIRRQLQSKRMCEGDSAQAQLMVKGQGTSVTMEGMEMMVAAMNSEQLGGGEAPACTGPPTTGRTPQQLRLG